ncbi:hypothetical protein H6F67_15665 [Microcoleus sp. FACHB-1515]|uniref:hypothetical protein n=1 Tax=Cyanophyceae TaxID=3028117 RepID=UPI001684D366|nr:hypothetical protein [Microcoleus sp. FACHB-1515]MBD2091292.1 hypothetical protein [Microcoleus sp. FACHB-1515]
MRQPTAKAAMVRVGKGSTAVDVHPKAAQMHILAVGHADHHPIQGLEVANSLPLLLRLTDQSMGMVCRYF